jgi:lipopolysaccharide/colanic/teichoic acid biosynthesis glycosyltransferase
MRNSYLIAETNINTDKEIIAENIPRSYLKMRRLMEFTFIIFFSPLILAIIIIIAVPVCICFRGKLIFRQKRAGTNGNTFTIYKFRTMQDTNGDAVSNNNHCDEKIGRFGCFMRKHRIDELPQFWNVLKGDMSIIGPRPEIIQQYEYYSGIIPGYRLRKLIPQGITGWAQINYPHSSTIEGNAEKLKLDIYYIRNISFKMDFIIICKTLLLILKGRISKFKY